jgi:hypothetical protein
VEFADGGLLISDTLRGQGIHDVDIYFHIHPDAKVDIRLDQNLAPLFFEPGTWHPEFNRSVPNYRAFVHYHGTAPVTFRSFVALR